MRNHRYVHLEVYARPDFFATSVAFDVMCIYLYSNYKLPVELSAFLTSIGMFTSLVNDVVIRTVSCIIFIIQPKLVIRVQSFNLYC